MIPLETLMTFIVASALLSLSPGPDNIFVLTQSALYGKKSGILITLGLCTGLIVHTAAVAFGIAVIFQTSTIAFTVLKTVGALYLLYLAWLAFSASVNHLSLTSAPLKTNKALYMRGIIMNITNPKVSIFFLAFLPQFVSPDNGAVMPQIFLLGTVFICVALVIFSCIAMMSGSLGSWLQSSDRAQVILNRIAGSVFAILALKLATVRAEIE